MPCVNPSIPHEGLPPNIVECHLDPMPEITRELMWADWELERINRDTLERTNRRKRSFWRRELDKRKRENLTTLGEVLEIAPEGTLLWAVGLDLDVEAYSYEDRYLFAGPAPDDESAKDERIS